jgi:hypothetical protein
MLENGASHPIRLRTAAGSSAASLVMKASTGSTRPMLSVSAAARANVPFAAAKLA